MFCRGAFWGSHTPWVKDSQDFLGFEPTRRWNFGITKMAWENRHGEREHWRNSSCTETYLFWLVVSTPLKNMLVKMAIFPKFRGDNKKYLKPPPSYLLHRIHGTGIFTYLDPIKINHPWIGRITNRPIDHMSMTNSPLHKKYLED